MIDNDISVIGTGEHEVSRTWEEFAAHMEKEALDRSESLIVEDDWYETRDLGNRLFSRDGAGQMQGRCKGPYYL